MSDRKKKSAKKDQRTKFVEKARELECEDRESAFDEALRKVSDRPRDDKKA